MIRIFVIFIFSFFLEQVRAFMMNSQPTFKGATFIFIALLFLHVINKRNKQY